MRLLWKHLDEIVPTPPFSLGVYPMEVPRRDRHNASIFVVCVPLVRPYGMHAQEKLVYSLGDIRPRRRVILYHPVPKYSYTFYANSINRHHTATAIMISTATAAKRTKRLVS